MREPLAFLLTWTCYGAWLHGDARGSVDKAHNTPRTPLVAPSGARRAGVLRRMKHGAYLLTPAGREVVEHAVDRHCEHRDWWLGAVNARSNHVHCVVTAPGVHPNRVMQELKAWSTRELRDAGLAPQDATLWTRHGSTKPLRNRRAVTGAMEYVLEHQDGPGKRRAPEIG
jgi:REP element-mobilizing transposase RayT